ncbi:MAG TPA: acyltransferase [Candidatus Didemnitutus sp.]|jgi:peptidoglycan/LPS O-acetylase OafA/YrhL
MKHINGLDSVRALAVLSVIFYHLGWPAFAYGWSGVTLFFVLSGFLITRILLGNRSARPMAFFGTFYLRRTLRIFPLYYLYLAVVFAWCRFFGTHAGGWLYFITYTQNYYLGGNGFSLSPGQELVHTWSLAVEEQFYLLWPLAVYFIPKLWLRNVIILLVPASAISQYYLNTHTHVVAFAPLSSNLAPLCLGAALALPTDGAGRLKTLATVMLAVGGLYLAGLFLWPAHFSAGHSVDLNASNPSFTTALAVFFAGLVGWVASTNVRLLEWSPLAYIGRISYGLYIWHAWALYLVHAALYNRWMPPLRDIWLDAIRLGLTFSIAVLSYHLFERPLLRLKDRLAYTGNPRSEAVDMRNGELARLEHGK